MSSVYSVSRLLLCLSVSLLLSQANADQTEVITEKTEAVVTEASPVETIKPNETPSLRPALVASERKLVQPSYLRKRLPESAIAYVRLPNVWDTLGTPGGSVLDPAVGSEAFVNAASGVKEGFVANLIPEFPEEIRLITKLVTQYISSPLEAVVLKSNNSGMPVPNVLITAAVNFETPEAVQAMLVGLVAGSPIKISKPIDENGLAEIVAGDLKGQVFWNKDLSRLFIFSRVSATPDKFASILENLKVNDDHSMLTAEKSIDESGQGIFSWVDPPQLLSIAKKMGIPASELAPLSMAGVNTMKSAALGAGTRNGINHLKLAVDMPAMGLRALIPTIKSSPTFNLNGKTNWVATLGLPDKSHIMAYQTMASMSAPEQMEDYNKFKEGFTEKLGFGPEDIFDFFGQDVSIVSGETGTFFAVRLNNKQAFDDMLEKSVKDFGLAYEQREVSGNLYHHLQFPNVSFDDVLKANLQKGFHKIAKRMISVPTHLYWQQEGDYLLIANLPQILMDRHDVSPSVPANEWLENKQRMDPEGALMMVSAVNNGVPESVYRMQLSMLSYFGDLTARPVDLFKLPTSREAKLPKKGSYGLKLTSSETQLAVELSYENNPLELFGGSTFTSTSVAGIAAFLIVSAQEEYETRQRRALLIPGITAARKVSKALDAHKAEYESYPGQAEIEALELEVEADTYTVSIEANTGKVIVEYDIDKSLGGSNTLTLVPPSEESTSWTCMSDIRDKYLPKSCH